VAFSAHAVVVGVGSDGGTEHGEVSLLIRSETEVSSLLQTKAEVPQRSLLQAKAEVRMVSPQKQVNRIPDQLILTGKWASIEEIPGPVGKNVHNTLALNHELHVHWFSDIACKEYLAKHFDQELADIFTKEARGSFRGDICRAAVLTREGGFYTDLDVQWLAPMRDLVDKSTTFMSAYGEGNDILNAVMATEPNSEIMQATLQELRKWYKDSQAHHDGWMGPATLRKALQDVQQKRCGGLDMQAHTLDKVCGVHNMRLYEQRKLNCNSEGRSAMECPPSRVKSHFDGVEFGLFEAGPEGKLVGWPRFAECSSWGCGGGGWDEKKLKV
jgi:mannosyltransferase OCH1-like enzyme